MKHLLLDLKAPLMAWGGPARSTYRPTDKEPTKSALLGLMGAAVGIDRSEHQRKKDFWSCFQVAFGVVKEGSLLVDYHTMQTLELPSKYKKRPRTRREELLYQNFDSDAKLHGTLTNREYLEDAAFVVCLRMVKEGEISLEQLRESILRPHFPLYCGRRCCPPAAPLNPRIVEAATFSEAFTQDGGTYLRFHWEGSPSEFPRTDRVHYRNDNPRGANKFGQRQEHVFEVVS